MTPVIRWALFLFLLTGFCGSCSHRYARHETAHRTEETSHQWKTAATTVVEKQSVATEKKQGSRETKRFRPDGTLMEQVNEQWGSDGRLQVNSNASSHAASTGHDFRSVKASSSSTTEAQTKAGLPWWLWALTWMCAAFAVALVGWRVYRRARTVVP